MYLLTQRSTHVISPTFKSDSPDIFNTHFWKHILLILAAMRTRFVSKFCFQVWEKRAHPRHSGVYSTWVHFTKRTYDRGTGLYPICQTKLAPKHNTFWQWNLESCPQATSNRVWWLKIEFHRLLPSRHCHGTNKVGRMSTARGRV